MIYRCTFDSYQVWLSVIREYQLACSVLENWLCAILSYLPQECLHHIPFLSCRVLPFLLRPVPPYPVSSCTVLPYPPLLCSALSCLAIFPPDLSYPTPHCHVLSCPVQSCTALPSPLLPYPVLLCPVLPCMVIREQGERNRRGEGGRAVSCEGIVWQDLRVEGDEGESSVQRVKKSIG